MTAWSLLSDEGLLPLGASEGAPGVALLADPGVVLHRVRLAATGHAARLAEAQALAAGLAAAPTESLHLALGAPGPDGSQWLAILSREAMERHLALLDGAPADRLVPAAALLPDPEGGTPSFAVWGGRILLKGPRFAGTAEPELAALLGAETPAPALEALLPAALPAEAPDLLQGPYAPRRAFWKDRRFRLAAAALVVTALLLALVPLGVTQVRNRLADEARDTATLAIASRALGQELTNPAEAEAMLRSKAAASPGAALGERLAVALNALESRPAVSLTALAFSPNAGLALTLSGPADAVNGIATALAAAPFAVQQQGERLTLAERKPPALAANATAAEARLLAVRDLAPLVALARRAPEAPPQQRLAAALASAGVVADVTPAPGGASVRLDAVRSTLLLPLVARLEATGTPISRLEATRNDDRSLNALMEVR